MSSIRLPEPTHDAVPEFVRALPDDGAGQIALFDADGTLWCDDVADDFVRWLIDQGHVATGGLWDEYLRVYREDHGAGCELMLRFYAGSALADIRRLAQRWWGQADRRWILPALESLRWLAARGYSNWIVTGSPTETMRPLLGVLPIDRIVGMDFEVDSNGIITGALAGMACTDEGKALKVRHLYGPGPISFAAGNGSLDEAMIALSERVAWAVYPNAEFAQVAERRGWHVLRRPADFVEEAKLA